MLGFSGGFTPKFSKKYANLHDVMLEAFKQYKEDCAQRTFPGEEHTFAISEEVMKELKDSEGVRRRIKEIRI
jgi:3-methyl-2-oxobutanoate hydroxymethyltransferase